MNTKPALFNTDMKSIRFPVPTADEEIRALLANRKTATRRVVKPQPTAAIRNVKAFRGDKGPATLFEYPDGRIEQPTFPYLPGDILYVRETWTKLWYVDPNGYTHFDQPMYYYAADGTPDITLYDEDGFELDDQRIRWHPSTRMPREAARIFLRVTDVRVERLQDISEDDVAREGIQSKKPEWLRIDFADLWNSTIKPADQALYGWAANPWVWVIEFERISREEV